MRLAVARRASAANSASASATAAFFAKHGSNALTTPCEIRVVPAALGLDADRDEHVGARVGAVRRTQSSTMRSRAGGTRAKSKPSPQTSTRSVAAVERQARRSIAGKQRARGRACSGSCRPGSGSRPRCARPACGEPVGLDERGEALAECDASNASSSSFEPQLETSATGCCAPRDQRAGRVDRRRELDGPPVAASAARARGRSKICGEVAPLVADPRPVDRRVLERRDALDARVVARGRAHSASTRACGARSDACSRARSPGHTEGVGCRYQTRDL